MKTIYLFYFSLSFLTAGWAWTPLQAQPSLQSVPMQTTLLHPAWINPAALAVRNSPQLEFQAVAAWRSSAPIENYGFSFSTPNPSKNSAQDKQIVWGTDFQARSDFGLRAATMRAHFALEYPLKNAKSKSRGLMLAYGMTMGLYIDSRDFSDYWMPMPQDLEFVQNQTGLLAGAGLRLYSERFSIGLSIPQLIYQVPSNQTLRSMVIRGRYSLGLDNRSGFGRDWSLNAIAQLGYFRWGYNELDILPLLEYKNILAFGPVLKMHFRNRDSEKNQTFWPGSYGGLIKISHVNKFSLNFGMMIPHTTPQKFDETVWAFNTFVNYSLGVTYLLNYSRSHQ